MPKGEHTVLATALDVARVKEILSSVLSGATIETLNEGPLDGASALAIVASRQGGVALKRSPFGSGNAVAQVVVEDHGSVRNVELIAIKDTFAEGFNRQRAAGNAIGGFSAAKQAPNIRCGRKMVDAIFQALTAADPGIRRVH